MLVDGRSLNQVLDESLRKKSVWTPAQRAALQDLSYGTLRFYGQLRALLGLLLHKPMLDQRIYYVLLVALYQLQYSKAAQHAAVDHAVRSAQMLNVKVSGSVNAILRNFLRSRDALLEQAARDAEGRYSYPQWWIDELRAQYGERSVAILEAGNRHPPMTLRVNRRRGTTADYLAQLVQQGISARLIEDGPIGFGALQLDKPVPVDKLPGFFDGFVSVQDAGAQYAALLLDVHDGMRVLDACAAPGGKAAHILESAAVQMVAVDKDENRLRRVAENLQRLELSAQLCPVMLPCLNSGGMAKPFSAYCRCALLGFRCGTSPPDIALRCPRILPVSPRNNSIYCARCGGALLAQDGKLLYATARFSSRKMSRSSRRFWRNSRMRGGCRWHCRKVAMTNIAQ